MPRLAAFPLNEQCGATARQTVAELADLAAAIESVGQTRSIEEQQLLGRAARVVSRLAVFLGKIDKANLNGDQQLEIMDEANRLASYYKASRGVNIDV